MRSNKSIAAATLIALSLLAGSAFAGRATGNVQGDQDATQAEPAQRRNEAIIAAYDFDVPYTAQLAQRRNAADTSQQAGASEKTLAADNATQK